VVHAGLELLLLDLKKVEDNVSDRLRELAEDIFAASGTAINILNDLLDYEHMDSGEECFKKSCSLNELYMKR